MADFYDAFDVRPFTLWLEVYVESQDIPNNRSYLRWNLRIRKDGNSTPFNNSASPWSVTIAGQNWTGSYAYNMNQAVGGTVFIASGNRWVTHNANGTMAIGVESYFNDNSGLLDYAFLSGSTSLPTIPRASSPSVSADPVDIGTPVTIYTNRASSSFTHTIKYSFGSSSGTLATGVGTEYVWTPALALMNEIPNATQANANITLETYSGGSLIGTVTEPITLTVPETVLPDFTTVTHSEATAGVAANVGAYVQNISKLNLAITGAAGAYGSTISSYQITAGPQTINAVSGTTPGVLSTSGTLALVGKITDSRGRVRTKTVNVTVLPYAVPTITSYSAQRSTAGGVVSPEGTSVRVDLVAAASSLMNTTERNDLLINAYTRERGTTTWSAPTAINPSGMSYNSSFVLAGPFDVTKSWDVRVEVVDDFSNTPVQSVVTVAEVFMHWGPSGVGFGKFHEQGRIDVNGVGHFSDGLRVRGTGADATVSSTDHALTIGQDTGVNLALDGNEILSRNNGAHSPLNINTETNAGIVNIGSAANGVDLNGRVLMDHMPYAMSAGSVVSAAVPATGNTAVAVTFPVGRFTQPPMVFVTLTTEARDIVVSVTSITSTGFTLNRGNTGSVIRNVAANWVAVQMTSPAGAG